jgi:acyl dehydratase
MQKNLTVGDTVSLTKAFSEEEVVRFAQISTDTNPIHLDEKYAANSVFGRRIVHGMLIASLFSGLIGTQLPGEGAIYLGQSLNFKAPLSIGEEVTATVEIIAIREDKPIVTLSTRCVTAGGQVVVDGEAVVKAG